MKSVSAGLRITLFSVAIVWPAEDWTWWEGWALIGVWIAYVSGTAVYLRRRNPELRAEHMKAGPAQAGQKGWDKALMSPMTVAGIGLLLAPGFDVVRFG